MAIYRSTTYLEAQPASPNERWGCGSSGFTREFILQDGSFKGRVQAAYDLLGYAVVVPTGGASLSAPGVANTASNAYISRVTPMPTSAISSVFVAQPKGLVLPNGILPPSFLDRFYAMGITKTTPWGAATGTSNLVLESGLTGADYAKAKITVEFVPTPFNILSDEEMAAIGGWTTNFTDGNAHPDEGYVLANLGWQNSRYISRHLEPFSRMIKIPFGMVWNAGFPPKVIKNLPRPTKEAIASREGGCNATYTWHRVPIITEQLTDAGLVTGLSGVNFQRIQNQLSSINNATFDIFPTGTLLFDHFSSREYQGAFGEWLADITFSFVALMHPSTGANFVSGNGGGANQGYPMGWNSIFDIVNGFPDYYQISTSDKFFLPLFPYSDFSALFRP